VVSFLHLEVIGSLGKESAFHFMAKIEGKYKEMAVHRLLCACAERTGFEMDNARRKCA
jgi:hypothetical protein